jgi:hypothetical protein
MLSSFEIINFRTFAHLRIESLGRVNLVVGHNGVGKTTLLEALRFHGMGSPLALREYLADQEEWDISGGTGEVLLDLGSLFHGRTAATSAIELGPIGAAVPRLRIRQIDAERVEESDGSYHYEEVVQDSGEPEGEVVRAIVVERGTRQILVSPEVSRRSQMRGKYVGPAILPARGVRESDLTYWWDSIALTPSQERVEEVLALLAPVDGITTTENPSERGARIFKARLRGENAPVPLRSLGGGVVRLFQIAVALEYAHMADEERGGSLLDERGERPWQERSRFLLVDEFENGIHYSVHADLWQAIFRLASQYDLQVFATSHSWDCLRGFAEAVQRHPECDAMAIRLEKVEGQEQTGAVIIDREDLPIVVRDSIEVR